MRIVNKPQQPPSRMAKMRKFVKQIFAQHSHLSKYLSLMTQSKQSRVCRLINDKSFNTPQPQEHIKGSLTNFLFPRLRVFTPTQNVMLAWYVFVFCAIIYYYIEMGLVLTFGEEVWHDELTTPYVIALDVITILILIVDVFVCLNCGYLYRGMIVMDYKRITSNYMRNHFIIDIVSIIIVVVCPISRYFYLNYAKLWLILKVKRLFQIDDYFLRRLNIHRKSKAFYVIFKLMVIIYMLSHVVGLIFYAIDFHLSNTKYADNQSEFCWLYSSTAYSPIIELSYSLRYLYTIYWGINTITTISYGDIAPNNPIQVNYAVLCFCFGFMVYGYVVNQIVKIILWAREHEDEFRAQLILMDTYMQKMDINKQLRRNIHDYLQFLHKEEKNRDLEMEAKMIQKIPEELRIQLLKNAYEIFYSKMLTIFYTNDIIRIFFYLNEKKFTHNQQIFGQGSRSNALFYLSKGKAQYVVKHGSMETIIYETQSYNELVGQYQVFIRQRWTYSAVCTVSSLIYSVDRVKLMDQINARAKLRERFKLIECLLLFQNQTLLIFYNCFFCKKEHHYLKCPEKFPNLEIYLKQKQDNGENPKRYPKPKRNTLTLKDEMNYLRNLKNRDNYGLITKVQKRLAKIKRRIESMNKVFQIDLAHDWEIFYPQFNFSKIREKWNNLNNLNRNELKIEDDQ